ncbi:uncharacterized protein LOC130623193 [Hydractinia symbiolongicarpus]|uniref:uncharacterized protein LOC130623193 n=1 Tax=Hydractinia symbiolongicarpus TaxID=13093 RepID=UPI00254D1752|nr:uncharacterized protein LOC130623193 [Hydractinia symbiolongicarpus]
MVEQVVRHTQANAHIIFSLILRLFLMGFANIYCVGESGVSQLYDRLVYKSLNDFLFYPIAISRKDKHDQLKHSYETIEPYFMEWKYTIRLRMMSQSQKNLIFSLKGGPQEEPAQNLEQRMFHAVSYPIKCFWRKDNNYEIFTCDIYVLIQVYNYIHNTERQDVIKILTKDTSLKKEVRRDMTTTTRFTSTNTPSTLPATTTTTTTPPPPPPTTTTKPKTTTTTTTTKPKITTTTTRKPKTTTKTRTEAWRSTTTTTKQPEKKSTNKITGSTFKELQSTASTATSRLQKGDVNLDFTSTSEQSFNTKIMALSILVGILSLVICVLIIYLLYVRMKLKKQLNNSSDETHKKHNSSTSSYKNQSSISSLSDLYSRVASLTPFKKNDKPNYPYRKPVPRPTENIASQRPASANDSKSDDYDYLQEYDHPGMVIGKPGMVLNDPQMSLSVSSLYAEVNKDRKIDA